MEENTVWKGSPSQILNLGTFAVCGVGAGLLTAACALFLVHMTGSVGRILLLICLLAAAGFAGVALWRFLLLRSRVYELTNERIHVGHGLLSRQIDDLELYRVKDITVIQPFLLRLFGRGNVILQTSDRTTPSLIIEAVTRPTELRDLIRKHVEACRDSKRVGELDVD